MAKHPFEDFVNKQVADSEDLGQLVSREVEITDWQEFLETLYRKIEQFLEPFTSQRKITIAYQAMSIREEFLGTYQVRSMEIQIGASDVHLEPIGTYLIGVKGRVDMIGSHATVRLVLVDKRSDRPKVSVTIRPLNAERVAQPPPEKPLEWTWKIATSTSPIRYESLNAESFYAALMEAVGG